MTREMSHGRTYERRKKDHGRAEDPQCIVTNMVVVFKIHSLVNDDSFKTKPCDAKGKNRYPEKKEKKTGVIDF